MLDSDDKRLIECESNLLGPNLNLYYLNNYCDSIEQLSRKNESSNALISNITKLIIDTKHVKPTKQSALCAEIVT